MRFAVYLLRHKGRPLARHDVANQPPRVGDMRVEEFRDERLMRHVRLARVLVLDRPRQVEVLCELYDPVLIAMSPQAFTLSGFEWHGEQATGCAVIDANSRRYCPRDFVTREQMGAFMGRLSDALYEPNAISPNIVGGSPGNNVTAGVRGATIAGGGVPVDGDLIFLPGSPNLVVAHYGTVGGGYANRAGMPEANLSVRAFATVGGGITNTAGGFASTVGGGAENTAGNVYVAVAGGLRNEAFAEGGAIGTRN